MKRYFFGLLAVVLTIASVAFTTTSENKTLFACQWFIYDDPTISDPALDFPTTLTQATTIENYRLADATEVASACPAVRKLCSICAEVDSLGNPKLGPTELIVSLHLTSYFITPENFRHPNLAFIREKFTF